MAHRRRPAGALGFALLLVSLGTALPARATQVSLQLPATHRLTLLGSGGDTAQPLIHPLLGEGLAGFIASAASLAIVFGASVGLRNDSPNFLAAGLPPIIL